MGEVIQLFKTLSPEEAKDKIIDNLKNMHHGKMVNYVCAINGLDNFELANVALDDLIDENIVEKLKYPVSDELKRTSLMSMYRYNSIRDLLKN